MYKYIKIGNSILERISKIFPALVITFISFAVFKVLMQIHAAEFDTLTKNAYGVLIGKPNWIAYQNRLLGSYIVQLISMIGLPFFASFKVYICFMTLVQNFLFYFLLRKLNMPLRKSLIWVMIYSFSFILIQHKWFYPWDSLDAILFMLFAWGILQRKKTIFFCILFL